MVEDAMIDWPLKQQVINLINNIDTIIFILLGENMEKVALPSQIS